MCCSRVGESDIRKLHQVQCVVEELENLKSESCTSPVCCRRVVESDIRKLHQVQCVVQEL
ncbi:hypothetical protein DPMN_169944 [Dreissena polymorpha]|uniref:Uncharacterized protein n=1 Tax=Dreissena polymorpha TaxID=45954 RepID=A0A9D4IDT9_DREPO|nr:hypothetical protein DPMN_169944 [Dreissena polymorpha]